jgi:hypothetical protein
MLFFLGVAYTPWMASFTETVEHHNPAAVAAGLAIWGWIIRIVVFASSLVILVVITGVTPLINASGYETQYPALAWAAGHPSVVSDYTTYASDFQFAAANPGVVATATKYSTQLANAAKFAPELAAIEKNPTAFEQAAAYSNPASIPAPLLAELIAAAGGNTSILTTISANQAAIAGVIAVAPQLNTLKPYAAQLTALSKVPPAAIAAVKANSANLTALGKVPSSVTSYISKNVGPAEKESPGQWRTWYWVCFAGIIAFLLSVPLLRGRWSPKAAKRDEDEHEALVQAELAKLQGASTS